MEAPAAPKTCPVTELAGTELAVPGSASDPAGVDPRRRLRWNGVTASFFVMGILMGLPAMVTTTAANRMFTGITGVYEVCASLTAALASLATPFLSRFISYSRCTAVCALASALAYVVCTLPRPLAGFVYAFGTNIYMAVAAFFPPDAVLALSVGSGCSVILGPAAFIGIMAGFDQDWRRTFLLFLPTVLGFPVIWWGLMDPACRAAAETSRLASLAKMPSSASSEMGDAQAARAGHAPGSERPGFGARRTRVGLLCKTMVPQYVVPLIICTLSATLSMMGTSPTLQALHRFRAAPAGDLQFQLVFLSYGSAQFLASTMAALRPMPRVWAWTAVQLALTVVGILQLFRPFLTFYAVWVAIMFLVGGCVGGAVTNTNHNIAEDFRLAGEPDEARSFAMSYSGLGNFGGDALGAALGVMVQQLATRNLAVSTRP